MDENNVFQLTETGLGELKARLELLRQIRRPAILDQIRETREVESAAIENGDYAQALTELELVDRDISNLEVLLAEARLMSRRKPTGHAGLGSRVALEFADGGSARYRIVDSIEADPLAGRISADSPLGRALLGHTAGEEVAWEAPAGELRARLMKVA